MNGLIHALLTKVNGFIHPLFTNAHERHTSTSRPSKVEWSHTCSLTRLRKIYSHFSPIKRLLLRTPIQKVREITTYIGTKLKECTKCMKYRSSEALSAIRQNLRLCAESMSQSRHCSLEIEGLREREKQPQS